MGALAGRAHFEGSGAYCVRLMGILIPPPESPAEVLTDMRGKSIVSNRIG